MRPPAPAGIDVDSSRHVSITDADVDTADDALCLKTTQPGRPLEHVTVSDCRCVFGVCAPWLNVYTACWAAAAGGRQGQAACVAGCQLNSKLCAECKSLTPAPLPQAALQVLRRQARQRGRGGHAPPQLRAPGGARLPPRPGHPAAVRPGGAAGSAPRVWIGLLVWQGLLRSSGRPEPRGLSTPSAPPRPAPPCAPRRDGGSISGVAFRNVSLSTRLYDPSWWGAAEPIYVTAVPRNASTQVRIWRGCPPACPLLPAHLLACQLARRRCGAQERP